MSDTTTTTPDLHEALDLLHRHHRLSGSAGSRGTRPTSAHFHSLWARLREARGAAEGGHAGCLQWLEEHRSLITAVERYEEVRREEYARGFHSGVAH